jgi:hypothetical protein
MAAQFTAAFEGEQFDVDITPDGELLFRDRDITYDQAMVAFGGSTPATKLLDAWQDDPIQVICDNLGLDDGPLRLLAADWAEHVLPLFEKAYPGDKRPRKAIEAARDFVAGKITAKQLEQARAAVWAAARDAAWDAARAARDAARAARDAAWAAAGTAARDAARAARDAARAARAAAAWDVARAAERSWQIRHFVRVMGHLQARKKWPKIRGMR